MINLHRIAVFCSTSPGSDAEFMKNAHGMGETLAKNGITLVYGGGGDGMAGAMVRAALAAGGEVIGVMPRFLVEKGRAFAQLKDLRVAKDLHEHKAIMAELGDGFIGLPGGLGTLEEFFEILTWAQLGLHQKPCGLLNVSGYFDQLFAFMDLVREKQFITPPVRDLMLTAENPDKILELFSAFNLKNSKNPTGL